MLDDPSNNASEVVKLVFGFWIPRCGFVNPNEDKFPLVHGSRRVNFVPKVFRRWGPEKPWKQVCSRVPTHFVCSKRAFSELSYMAL